MRTLTVIAGDPKHICDVWDVHVDMAWQKGHPKSVLTSYLKGCSLSQKYRSREKKKKKFSVRYI